MIIGMFLLGVAVGAIMSYVYVRRTVMEQYFDSLMKFSDDVTKPWKEYATEMGEKNLKLEAELFELKMKGLQR